MTMEKSGSKERVSLFSVGGTVIVPAHSDKIVFVDFFRVPGSVRRFLSAVRNPSPIVIRSIGGRFFDLFLSDPAASANLPADKELHWRVLQKGAIDPEIFHSLTDGSRDTTEGVSVACNLIDICLLLLVDHDLGHDKGPLADNNLFSCVVDDKPCAISVSWIRDGWYVSAGFVDDPLPRWRTEGTKVFYFQPPAVV